MGEKMTLHFNDTIYRPDWVDLLSKTKEIDTKERKKTRKSQNGWHSKFSQNTGKRFFIKGSGAAFSGQEINVQ